jgi:hypothetical protein
MNSIISTLLMSFTLLFMLFLHVLDPISDVPVYDVAEKTAHFIIILILKDIIQYGVYQMRRI